MFALIAPVLIAFSSLTGSDSDSSDDSAE